MYEYKIKEVLKVYDGDTITVRIDLGFDVHRTERIRFALINAPEVRGEQRPDGLISRDWLAGRIQGAIDNGQDLIIRTQKDKKGKYGRYICELFIDELSVNMQMIAEGYAVAY